MHRILWILCSVMLYSTMVQAQKHYHMWAYGRSAGQSIYPSARCIMDFREDTVTTYPSGILINIRGVNAAICDHEGNLVLYTNGHFIADSTHQVILNGSDLNPSIYFNPTYQNYDCLNCHSFINWGDSLYTLIHIGMDGSQGLSANFRYLHRTDVYFDNLLDDFTTQGKNSVIADGKYELFNIVRHGNGVDYWVVQPALQQDTFHFYLLTPDTMYRHHSQEIGPHYQQGLECYARGGNSISPDGRKYVRFNNKCSMWLYDIDRCDGLLSNPREVQLPVLPIQPGGTTEFSGNSRYLYFTSSTVVYQIDTEASELIPDTVAVYDGFTDPFATFFHSMSRMPDGRIYITSTNGVLSLHVIEHPDSAGLACQVNQHSFPLKGTISWGILRPVNVWLGPADCDTVSVITAQRPVVRGLRVYPQPATGEVMIELQGGEGVPHPRHVRIYSAEGRQVYSGPLPPWSYMHRLSVAGWPPGMYTILLEDAQGVIATGQLLVMRP